MRTRSHLPRLVVLALAAAAHAGCASLAGVGGVDDGPARLTAKIVFAERPLEGARVAIHTDAGGKPAPEPLEVAGPADEKGEIQTTLAPGRYYLVAGADESSGAPRYHAWFGGNPVALGAGDRAYVVLNTVDDAVPVSLAVADEARLPGSGVMGVVADTRGQPVAGAYVYAYLTPKKGFRDRPYELSARTTDEGFFSLALPPGPYYLVARWRRSGGFAGPMGIGDAFGTVRDNPFRVPEEGYERIALRVAEILDPAVVADTASEINSQGRAPEDPIDPEARFVGPANPFRGHTRGDAVLRGTIRDAHGDPVEGFHATLYRNPDFLWQPDAMSARTGPDGRFELTAPEPGTFYVGARNYYGRQLEEGDFYGFYQGPEEAGVTVHAGDTVDGIDIQVEEYGFD